MGQVIHESGKRLERLIENFLIYAQIELLGSRPAKDERLCRKGNSVRPAKAASATSHASRPAWPIERGPASSTCRITVPMSEDYLAKIVDEIVQNAFKFSESGTQGAK